MFDPVDFLTVTERFVFENCLKHYILHVTLADQEFQFSLYGALIGENIKTIYLWIIKQYS